MLKYVMGKVSFEVNGGSRWSTVDIMGNSTEFKLAVNDTDRGAVCMSDEDVVEYKKQFEQRAERLLEEACSTRRMFGLGGANEGRYRIGKIDYREIDIIQNWTVATAVKELNAAQFAAYIRESELSDTCVQAAVAACLDN